MAVEVHAARIGGRAARLLQQHGDWRVEAVFNRSLYLRSGAEFICIGDRSIGDGPLNAIAAGPWPACAVGDAARVRLVDATVVWIASGWPPVPQSAQLATTIGRLKQAAGLMPPSDCIAAAVFSGPRAVTHFARRADAGISAMRNGDYCQAVDRLLGLGVGLTPGGDDVLAAALITLHATSQPVAAQALGQAVLQRAAFSTSALSAAFLRAAAHGEPSAPILEALRGLLHGQPSEQVIAALADVGHTSGWEMLAGIVIVLEAAA